MVAPQPCPALRQNRRMDGVTATSRSAPGRITVGDLPPSSSTTFFAVGAAAVITAAPTAFDPVNVTMSTSGWELSRSPTAGSPGTRFSTPGGIPASSASRRNATEHSAPRGEGIRTTEQPAASAGATFQLIMLIG